MGKIIKGDLTTMCLIVFSWQPEAQYPLVLTANRDEFYRRPTKSVHFWQDHPHIIGGRDLQAGGTWMAFSRTGRFAAVTNYREIPPPSGQFSRGKLVSDFLNDDTPAIEYLASIHSLIENNENAWSGFNLLTGDKTGLYYYSNRSGIIQSLAPGLYGLSNHLLDSPWPKVQKAKAGLQTLLDDNNYATPESLIAMMHNSDRYADQELPETGLTRDQERQLSSCFISSPDYGTRNTSALILDNSSKLHWHEQLYGPDGMDEVFQFNLNFPVSWTADSRKASTL